MSTAAPDDARTGRRGAGRWAGPSFLLAVVVSAVLLFAPSGGGGGSFPPGSDKVVHALIFAALAGTARWRFGAAWAVLGAVAGYAVLSELLQAALLSARSGDPYDVVADLAGALLGWWLAGRLGADRRPS